MFAEHMNTELKKCLLHFAYAREIIKIIRIFIEKSSKTASQKPLECALYYHGKIFRNQHQNMKLIIIIFAWSLTMCNINFACELLWTIVMVKNYHLLYINCIF